MSLEELFKDPNVCLGLFLRAWRDRMTWHRDGERHSLGILKAKLAQLSVIMRTGTYNPGRNLLQPLGSGLSFRPAAVEAVIKFEQWLSHRVREGYSARVNERNLANTPTLTPASEEMTRRGLREADHKRTRNVAPKGARAE